MSAPMLSLVIPTYNERENVQASVDAAHEALGAVAHEILVVDDDSPDGTWKEADQLSQTRPWLRVIRRVGRRGLSAAVIEGFDAARGDLLGVMDADLSHDEKILPALVAAAAGGADLAIGSRRIPGGGATRWPWYRRLTSSAATFMAKVLLGLTMSDPMSGFFVARRAVFERSRGRLEPQGYKILLELYCTARPGRVEEIPFIFKDRRQGYSKLSTAVMRDFVRMLFRLRRNRSLGS